MSYPEIRKAMGMKSHGYLSERRNWAVRFMRSREGVAMHDRLLLSLARKSSGDEPPVSGALAGKFEKYLHNHAGGAA